MSKNIIEKFVVLVPKGHLSDGAVASRNKTGYFLVKDRTIHDLFDKIRLIVTEIDVLNPEGNSIMDKTLFEETLTEVEPYYS